MSIVFLTQEFVQKVTSIILLAVDHEEKLQRKSQLGFRVITRRILLLP